jgi:hypothetical protein
MVKKSKTSEDDRQLSLLETENHSNSETTDDDWLSGDFGFDSDGDACGGLRLRTSETQKELLSLKLLRETIEAQNPGDRRGDLPNSFYSAARTQESTSHTRASRQVARGSRMKILSNL